MLGRTAQRGPAAARPRAGSLSDRVHNQRARAWPSRRGRACSAPARRSARRRAGGRIAGGGDRGSGASPATAAGAALVTSGRLDGVCCLAPLARPGLRAGAGDSAVGATEPPQRPALTRSAARAAAGMPQAGHRDRRAAVPDAPAGRRIGAEDARRVHLSRALAPLPGPPAGGGGQHVALARVRGQARRRPPTCSCASGTRRWRGARSTAGEPGAGIASTSCAAGIAPTRSSSVQRHAGATVAALARRVGGRGGEGDRARLARGEQPRWAPPRPGTAASERAARRAAPAPAEPRSRRPRRKRRPRC